ncbi:hypothetical protein EVAR_53059_1 [Eumeta japonica]|uniref:Uncharacterized protein n=1 Tax=Eumeta variegata TaxID=151549 RepID=A0A4C1YW45_EUMVA|nr:hypothetical protein EVAR_53059_1 [Eumeta japonica]
MDFRRTLTNFSVTGLAVLGGDKTGPPAEARKCPQPVHEVARSEITDIKYETQTQCRSIVIVMFARVVRARRAARAESQVQSMGAHGLGVPSNHWIFRCDHGEDAIMRSALRVRQTKIRIRR